MPTSKKPKLESEAGFDPRQLDRSAIALPLLELLAKKPKPKSKPKPKPGGPRRGTATAKVVAAESPALFDVIIDPHLTYRGGRDKARARIRELIAALCTEGQVLPQNATDRPRLHLDKTELSRQYVFARLSEKMVRELVRRDRDGKARAQVPNARAIYRVWPDFVVNSRIHQSIRTVKADAAINAFGTAGDNIVWAVLDSGVDALHPHFERFRNLDLSHDEMLEHKDLSGAIMNGQTALIDRFGHGTHVAGIIAGQIDGAGRAVARTRRRDENGEVTHDERKLDRISGMAPRCKLLSVKVLDDNGAGQASSVIVALEYIQKLNEYGRMLRVHGVNLSAGYKFEPEWFACGQSPLCVEVDRLVKSGVVVVVAAGNTGYGHTRSAARGDWSAGLPLSINDPGNAELAITVGSTHREMPHVYGVSYFSSKGPTGDGRAKPDLVAPGEKIVSCTSAWAETHWAAPKPDQGVLAVQLDAWAGTPTSPPAVPAVDNLGHVYSLI